MKGPTRNLTAAIIIVAGLVAIVPGVLALTNCIGLRGEHGDWFVAIDAASLVQFSDQIVIARHLDATIYETPNSSTAYPGSRTSLLDVYRGFKVVESVKGDLEAGDTAYVRWSEGYYRKDANGNPEFIERPSVALMPGETYALFLTPFPGRRPPDLEPGARVWQPRTGVGVARVGSLGRLSFVTDAYYRAALKDLGLDPVEGSGAPFELTIDGVRDLLATGADTGQQ